MATVLPPPSKRQKTAAAARAREQVSPPPAPPEGKQRLQFCDADSGELQGPVVTLDLVDLTPKNLSLLLNGLLGRTNPDDRIPYRFYNPLQDGSGEFDAEAIIKSYISGDITTENLLKIPTRAEAVFRVKAVTRCSASITGHGSSILATAFSPATSSRLATGSGDNTARIWDCETGTPLYTLAGHKGWVLVVAWSPDEKILATGSTDNTLRLWDPATGNALGGPLKGHKNDIRSIAWEPYHLRQEGRPRLASASKDYTIRIWDAVGAHTDAVLSGHKDTVASLRWGGAGESGLIYSASYDKTIKIWDPNKGTLLNTLSAHAHWVNHIALSTDHVLRTGYFDHKGQKEAPADAAAKRQKAKERYLAALKPAGGIERLVSASDDCTMYLWAPSQSPKPLQRMFGHQKQVNHVAFSPDGTLIASAAFDNHVKLWQAQDGKFLSTLRGHVGAVYQCAFSPDSRLLVSCSKDTTLKAWDVRSATLKENLPGHQDEVFAVDWSPDGNRVGSGGQDKAVRIWRH